MCGCEVTTLTPPTATNDCGQQFTGTSDVTLPITTKGTTVVTWTYDDGNGNTATQTQIVVIDDTTPPTVVTQNISVDLDAYRQCLDHCRPRWTTVLRMPVESHP